MAAIALVCAVPMTWALVATGAGRPEAMERHGFAANESEPSRSRDAFGSEPPVVSITLEPIRDLPPVMLDGIAPVIAEETQHGGG